jgi:pre-60S factor REI1
MQAFWHLTRIAIRPLSFFIPDHEYLIDLDGLLRYLGLKIAQGHVCLFCNNKGRNFHSMDAVRKHMVEKVWQWS